MKHTLDRVQYELASLPNSITFPPPSRPRCYMSICGNVTEDPAKTPRALQLIGLKKLEEKAGKKTSVLETGGKP